MTSPKNKPLTVTVTKGVLRIEIGVETLAFAALSSPAAYDLQRNWNDPANRFSIPDPRGFTVDVAHALKEEAEDGSTIVTRMLDRAIEDAIEGGSEYFVDAEGES